MMNLKKKFFYTTFLSICFLLIYIIIYYLHVRFFHVKVLFYSSLFDVFISVLIVNFFFLYKNFFLTINLFEKYLLLIIFSLTGYIISMSVPALIDRSLSFYLLEKIDQSKQGINISRIDDLFINDFVIKYDMINVRLTEQQASGTIAINNNCAVITRKGKFLANFSKFFRANLLPKHRISEQQLSGHKFIENTNLSDDQFEYYKCTQ